MEYEVLARLQSGIDFSPKSEVEEVLQNVRTIITTPKYSVPLNRDFGAAGSMVDTPTPVAQARLTAEIVTAVNQWEPRVQITNVSFVHDTDKAGDGMLVPKVRLKLRET